MFLYKRKDSPNWWIGGIEENGKRKARPLHKFLKLPFPVTDRNTAQQLMASLRMKAIRGELGVSSNGDSPTITTFYSEFFDFYKKNRTYNTTKTAQERLGRWIRFLDRERVERVSQINQGLFDGFLEQDLRGRSNATLNRYTSVVRTAFEWGIRKGYLKENPLKRALHYKEPRPDKSFSFMDEDLEKLFSLEDKTFSAFLKVTYYSLGRRSEVLKLKWSDLDFKRKIIKFVTPKSQSPEIIEMAEKLIPVFQSLRNCTSCSSNTDIDRIFPYSENYATKKFQKVRDKLNLKSIRRIHDLRSARVIKLLEEGVDIKTVQEVARHKNVLTTLSFYAFTSKEKRREAINA